MVTLPLVWTQDSDHPTWRCHLVAGDYRMDCLLSNGVLTRPQWRYQVDHLYQGHIVSGAGRTVETREEAEAQVVHYARALLAMPEVHYAEPA